MADPLIIDNIRFFLSSCKYGIEQEFEAMKLELAGAAPVVVQSRKFPLEHCWQLVSELLREHDGDPFDQVRFESCLSDLAEGDPWPDRRLQATKMLKAWNESLLSHRGQPGEQWVAHAIYVRQAL